MNNWILVGVFLAACGEGDRAAADAAADTAHQVDVHQVAADTAHQVAADTAHQVAADTAADTAHQVDVHQVAADTAAVVDARVSPCDPPCNVHPQAECCGHTVGAAYVIACSVLPCADRGYDRLCGPGGPVGSCAP